MNDKPDDIQYEIEGLAALPKINYEKIRKEAANILKVSVAVLDDAVRDARQNIEQDNAKDTVLSDPAPWPTKVDGAELLDEITELLKRFVILPEQADKAIALWIIMTYLTDHVEVLPILAILSPEKRCGKTTLLSLTGKLVSRPLSTANITPAAIFRTVEKYRPTLLIDEADTFIRKNDELRGIINSGHTKDSAYVIRTVGDSYDPQPFSTWGAKAIACIGNLPDTTQDRSIIVRLRRKLANESANKLRHAEIGIFNSIRRRCVRFTDDLGYKIARNRPNIPDQLNDRAGDNWEPLLSIAEQTSGHWPETARKCAIEMSSNTDNDAESGGVQLLTDIFGFFQENGAARVFSEAIVAALIELDDRPWADWNRGQPITKNQLARKLKPFGVRSRDIRAGIRVARGYTRESFEDAFNRYLRPEDATLLQPNADQDSSGNTGCYTDSDVAPSQTLKPNGHTDCSDVALHQKHHCKRTLPTSITNLLHEAASKAASFTGKPISIDIFLNNLTDDDLNDQEIGNVDWLVKFAVSQTKNNLPQRIDRTNKTRQ